ncbi:cbb3-type cytochrome oxidase assembly protein CcoS [Noviherbaspirillum denitrificans]|uniref:Cytochrome C oxidase Cbb3 n=1 Tax=Noviherbaspirillum denitrificans TaxID=1968433 RepID=A0A254TG96_9BURK|nr:cbb3-type cytochrome oxidase assembly protein CcoS [Noviherbaspirillum denitrificans]OWW21681.1 cytochrome C oxidase Cbb3 [Noviherbaspirillum denitrificans]
MEALYLLIPLSIIIVFIAIWVFFRASDTGQFDDLVGPGMRILQDDDRPQVGESSDKTASEISKKD